MGFHPNLIKYEREVMPRRDGTVPFPSELRAHWGSNHVHVTSALTAEGLYLLCFPRTPDFRTFDDYRSNARQHVLTDRGVDSTLALLIAETEERSVPRFSRRKICKDNTLFIHTPLSDAQLEGELIWCYLQVPLGKDIPHRLELWKTEAYEQHVERGREKYKDILPRVLWIPPSAE